ncbi:MAG: DUF86 domain-containing protein [Candidatus Micrarchaeia archaeon]
MKRDYLLYMDDIIESIQRIDEYLLGLSYEQFAEDLKLVDAVSRRLEIIGEAVKNIPVETKEKQPGLPWKGIVGMRDVLAHGYFGIDPKRVWNIAKNDLPSLRQGITALKASIENEGKGKT